MKGVEIVKLSNAGRERKKQGDKRNRKSSYQSYQFGRMKMKQHLDRLAERQGYLGPIHRGSNMSFQVNYGQNFIDNPILMKSYYEYLQKMRKYCGVFGTHVYKKMSRMDKVRAKEQMKIDPQKSVLKESISRLDGIAVQLAYESGFMAIKSVKNIARNYEPEPSNDIS